MTGPDRRTLLAGLAAATLLPAAARADDGADTVGAALDAAAASPPAEGLRRLDGIDTATLDRRRRLDVATARAGLAIDARLAARDDTKGRSGGFRPQPGSGRIAPDHYALLLQRALGTADPRALQRRLTGERDRLHAQAARAFAAIGMTTGSVGERYRTLWRDPRFLYADDESGRAAAVADMAALLAAARFGVAALVGPVPVWCLDVEVRGLSPQELAAGRNGYRIVPTPTQRGAYIVDLRRIRARPRWTLPAVVAHELLPGHMIQLGLEGIAAPHPLRVDYAAAFVEGWGVHAETLALPDDPHARLGRLHWLLFRVHRALVDLGVHLDGWSREEARARLVAWQGEPAYFAPFDTELTRIAQEPASRAAEAAAWLAIADAAGTGRGGARITRHRRLLVDGRMRIEAMRNTF